MQCNDVIWCIKRRWATKKVKEQKHHYSTFKQVLLPETMHEGMKHELTYKNIKTVFIDVYTPISNHT